jgi:hypothetical protein
VAHLIPFEKTRALAFTLKRIFKAKEEELWEIQIFSPCKNIMFK